MSNLRLSFVDDDPWPINQKLFDQLRDYLQSDSSVPASTVAERLDSLFPPHRSLEDQSDGEPIEDISTFFWNIWEPFHIAARQLPHDSEAQEKLVSCIDVIQNTTSKTPIVKIDSNHGLPEVECRLWQDMHQFGGTFWEMAHFMEGEIGIEDQWRNMMAYAARLTREGISNLSFFGKKSLVAALGYTVVEQDRRGRPGRDILTTEFTPGPELDQNVAVAADWIMYAGSQLFEEFNENTGNKEKDAHGWQFWKLRFEEILEDERISAKTRGSTKVAMAEMEQVEARSKGTDDRSENELL